VTPPLSGRPPLDPGEVAAALAGTRWRPEVLAESPSTNAVLAGRVREGAAEGLLVVADHQTAGRGRLDRTWVTPAGAALTFSLLLTPDEVPVVRWPWLPLLTGVAVAEGVRRVAGVEVALKWPNDVLAGPDASTGPGRRKVAGILVERVEGPHGAGAVVGVGLNVAQTAEELPVDTATSLQLVAGSPVDRTALLAAVVTALADHYDRWRAAGGDARAGLLAAYSALCDTVGRTVRVQLPDGGSVTGDAVGVDDDGRLRIRCADGLVALGAGDVVHVRPASPRA
jgi:BirA family transcriptional regulator, biotin operon repressor / biotin---[acetyl-CoA-carboxylase] ligase